MSISLTVTSLVCRTLFGAHYGVLSHLVLSLTLWTIACRVPLSLETSQAKNTGAGHHFPLQGIFLTQGSNLSLLHLLHWQVDSLPLHHLALLLLFSC